MHGFVYIYTCCSDTRLYSSSECDIYKNTLVSCDHGGNNTADLQFKPKPQAAYMGSMHDMTTAYIHACKTGQQTCMYVGFLWAVNDAYHCDRVGA